MKFKYVFFGTLFLIILQSCGKDFLNFPVSGTIVKQEYVKDLQTTQEYLNGIHNNLANVFAGVSVLYPEVIADNIKPSTGGSIFILQYNWQQRADATTNAQDNINNFSYVLYSGIVGCNFVIESAKKLKEENEDKARLLEGQALALRALCYSYLLNYYSQSYNYSSSGTHPGLAINLGTDWRILPDHRSTVGEVFELMINDLKTAVPLLSKAGSNTFYFNQNAAKGLLARLLLAKNDYAGASKYSREVLNAVPIMTVNYPAKLFTLQETEALFQVPQNEQIPITFASYYLRTSIMLQATNDIADLLNESTTDTRRGWITKVSNSWNIIKYPQNVIPNVTTQSISYYHTVLRSSEMCLIAAESYAHLNITDSAKFYLDAIRKRADPVASATNLSGTALLEAIYKERRKELAFEGFRMFDLLRWKKNVFRSDVSNILFKELPYPNNMAIAPIPLNDVQLSGLTQNTGY